MDLSDGLGPRSRQKSTWGGLLRVEGGISWETDVGYSPLLHIDQHQGQWIEEGDIYIAIKNLLVP